MVALACLCSVCLPLWRCSWVGQGRVRLGSSRARVVNSFPAVLCTARAALLALSCVLCCCRGYRWVRVCVRVQVEGPGCPSPAPTWSLALPAFRRLRDCVAAAHSKVHHARTHSRPHTHTHFVSSIDHAVCRNMPRVHLDVCVWSVCDTSSPPLSRCRPSQQCWQVRPLPSPGYSAALLKQPPLVLYCCIVVCYMACVGCDTFCSPWVLCRP